MNEPLNQQLHSRYPNLSLEPIPSSRICSQAYFEKERDAIFRNTWLQIARTSDLPKPGSYFVRDIPTLSTSVIVTRTRDGALHAFKNVCPHRGMKLCVPGTHTHNRINCPFHGWAFDLSGQVAGIPGEEYFFDFDKADHGLKPVNVGEWSDLVFVNFSPEPEQSLQVFLGELYDDFHGFFATDHWQAVRNYNWTLDFNWKLYLDSSVEGYHAAYVHLFNNTGQVAATNPDPLWLPNDWVRLFKDHRVVGVPQNVGERELAPMEALAFQYGAVAAYNEGGVALPPGINNTKSKDWAFDILEVFPNSVLFLSANLFGIIRLWPVAANRTHCELEVYLPTATTAAGRVSQEYGVVSLRDVVREDMNTAVAIQSVAEPDGEFVLCDQEIAVRHQYETIHRHVENCRSHADV
ncbi:MULTISPECIES: aromatic ring-hydroxylating oxygenase subunit alpha [unclassified Sphingomonas]|uniref:aromatic ring-hydroxylating oxygenase subunit alpha n=1 Tax=unclassified Sphingomonas TaxID=196159 RepID=UPI00027CBBB6|nr:MULTISPECIES: SRPBCC family protein [unclassified Sphingomonas]EJU15015.1 3-phenylpropionate/cinnamic acid dioxygenase subunit alpha [Sphingomonas sp. LH128]